MQYNTVSIEYIVLYSTKVYISHYFTMQTHWVYLEIVFKTHLYYMYIRIKTLINE